MDLRSSRCWRTLREIAQDLVGDEQPFAAQPDSPSVVFEVTSAP